MSTIPNSGPAEGETGRLTNAIADMMAFDGLPKALRRALAYLPDDESAEFVADVWLSGEKAGVPEETRTRVILRNLGFCPAHIKELMAEGEA